MELKSREYVNTCLRHRLLEITMINFLKTPELFIVCVYRSNKVFSVFSRQ